MEKQIWQQLKTKIFLNRGILKKKTKILLWEALVRSTLTYELQTNLANEQNTRKIEQFMFKNIRQIEEPHWFIQKKKPANTIPEI